MIFMAVFAVLLVATLYASTLLSPYTERMMSHIWQDPTSKMKLTVAKRVKELCVDGNVPIETAALMIAKENNAMEAQVRELMRMASVDPAIMKLAFGSKSGNFLVLALKKYRMLDDQPWTLNRTT